MLLPHSVSAIGAQSSCQLHPPKKLFSPVSVRLSVCRITRKVFMRFSRNLYDCGLLYGEKSSIWRFILLTWSKHSHFGFLVYDISNDECWPWRMCCTVGLVIRTVTAKTNATTGEGMTRWR